MARKQLDRRVKKKRKLEMQENLDIRQRKQKLEESKSFDIVGNLLCYYVMTGKSSPGYFFLHEYVFHQFKVRREFRRFCNVYLRIFFSPRRTFGL